LNTAKNTKQNEHLEHEDGEIVFRHACKLWLEGVVSKRKGSPYRCGRSPDWLKMKNPDAPAAKGEAEEDWGVREHEGGQGRGAGSCPLRQLWEIG